MITALTFLALVILGGATAAQTADALAEIRTLYNSAAYEEALTKLAGLQGVPAAQVEPYRAFCLLALGRREEAVASVAKAVDADPLWTPTAGDASPRVQAFYEEERRKLLPDIARAVYVDARAAYVAKNYQAAVTGFTRVHDLLASAGRDDSGLSDLGLLAEDFLQLARASTAPPSAPAGAPAPGPVAAAPGPPAPAVTPSGGPTRGPVAINQKLPVWMRTTWQGNLNGLLHIEIDETGAVTNATIVRPTQPQYDVLVLEAARSWRYEPALRAGRPVPSSKDITFVLKP